MRSLRHLLACALAALAVSACSGVVPQGFAQQPESSLIETGTPVPPPPGFVSFCMKHPGDCPATAHDSGVIELTGARFDELERVQEKVNQAIEPRIDPQHVWDYPVDGTGDCNKYALEKRRELIALGWPRHDLLLAVVITETHEGHLVLVAQTSGGDLVLDNRVRTVVAWNRLPYHWVALQSAANSTQWFSVSG